MRTEEVLYSAQSRFTGRPASHGRAYPLQLSFDEFPREFSSLGMCRYAARVVTPHRVDKSPSPINEDFYSIRNEVYFSSAAS